MAEEDDDIYDIAPSDRTVMDIGKLKNMFEQQPMGVYSPGNRPTGKAFQEPTDTETSPTNKPPTKPKPGFISPFKNELQNKIQPKTAAAPSLPGKSRNSVINGEIGKHPQPALPKKTGPHLPETVERAPPPVAPKSKPKTDTNHNVVSKRSPPITPVKNKPQSPTSPRKTEDAVHYIGDAINGPSGNKYRMVKCPSSKGNPPKKPSLPEKVDIQDLTAAYADDMDDMYDDVIADESTRPISEIPEFTEEDEKALAKEAKAPDDQEEYDDVRAEDDKSSRENKSLSMMSTGSDIYESFDEVEAEDVKL